MGVFGLYFFGEADSVLVEEIAKNHKLPVDVVEKHYREMLNNIAIDVQTNGKTEGTCGCMD